MKTGKMEKKMNKLTALAIATIVGWCFAWYADSYAAFKGTIG